MPKIKPGYETCLIVVLMLFYFCSLEPVSLLSDLGIARFFTLGRYICYLALGLLAFYNLAGRKIGSIAGMFKRVLEFLKNHLFLCFFSLCMAMTCICASVIEPLVIDLVLICCWKCDVPKLFKAILISQAIFFVLIVGLSQIGILENLTFNRDGEYRSALGFIYPLELQSLFFFMALEWFYIRKDKYGPVSIVLIALVNVLFYYRTRARFSTALLLVACLCFLLLKYVPKLWARFKKPEEEKKSWITPTRIGGVLIGGWISMLTLFYYTITQHFLFSFYWKPIYRVLDRIFNNRIILARGAYVDYGYHAFGQTIDWIGLGGVRTEWEADKVGKKYNYVDVSYFKNLFDYGYVFMFFFLLFYGITWFNSFKKKDYVLSVIITMILLGAVFEPRLVQISLNPFLILFAPLLMVDNAWILSLFSKVKLYG